MPEEVAEKSLEYKQRVVYPRVAAMFREGGRGEAEFKVFYGEIPSRRGGEESHFMFRQGVSQGSPTPSYCRQESTT